MSFRAIASIAAIFLGLLVTAALAQQFAQTAATTCTASTRGSVACPEYTAPAATAVPGKSLDGSLNIPAATSTTLFSGAVPPNAFMVQVPRGGQCVINDNGPANGTGVSSPGPTAGFLMTLNPVASNYTGPPSFITPPGYKPIGPVSIWCTEATYVAARGW
jgi:hypothetical protein